MRDLVYIISLVQGVQEKLCFFTIHCYPSLAYIAETFKAFNEMRVYSPYYWLVIFCTTNSSRVVAMEKLSKILGKNTIFN